MKDSFGPMLRQNLSEALAQRIRRSIMEGQYRKGDRLPTIMEMARRFGVGHPTVREALKKLETIGFVEIRHGSGVYVTRAHDVLVHASPGYSGSVTRKLLLDLVEARIPIEMHSVAAAARNAGADDLTEMRRLLTVAGDNLDDDEVLSRTNMAFHSQIALASANTVLSQLLDVLQELFQEEQRLILDIHGSRRKDHEEHLAILEALEQADEERSVERMRAHLDGVREVLLRWSSDAHPLH